MGRRRLSLSPLLFCNLVEDLRSANEGFFWSNQTFGWIRDNCRLGCFNESWSHRQSCERLACFFCPEERKIYCVADLLCGSQEKEARIFVDEWAYINCLKRSCEPTVNLNKKVEMGW